MAVGPWWAGTWERHVEVRRSVYSAPSQHVKHLTTYPAQKIFASCRSALLRRLLVYIVKCIKLRVGVRGNMAVRLPRRSITCSPTGFTHVGSPCMSVFYFCQLHSPLCAYTVT